jgi:tetratricopeptide (TPR) repeat protein
MNDYLQQKFPDMVPVTAPPALSTVNGIGFTVYGHRDDDAETGTYVKTHCFCVLFIPLFCAKAFRVANAAEGGWYFLGKVPLSTLAKLWNFMVLGAIVLGGGLGYWAYHTSRPDYKAQHMLDQADALVADGELSAAADLYKQVALGDYPNHKAIAVQKLGELFDSSAAVSHPHETVTALEVALDVDKAGRKVDRLYERTLAIAVKVADGNPTIALKLTAPFVGNVPKGDELAKFRLPLLEKALAKDPNNVELICDMALMLEALRDYARCEKLLAPHAAKLGTKEGARILGQIYTNQGKFEEAFPLLGPYVEDRLQRYLDAEKNWQMIVKQIDDESGKALQERKATGFDYAAHNKADKATQVKMVQEYLDSRLRNHPNAMRAQADYQRENRVVPVALDLGEVYLRRAQRMNDPERKQELEKAEKLFLAVRNTAGKLDEYRLNLGQVYYVLGKDVEARKLFDEFLKDANNDPLALSKAGAAYRQVGMESDAKALLEKAYNTEQDQKKKYAFARIRSVMAAELDEQILWLERASPDEPATKAGLCGARGLRALLAGKEDEAAREFRQGIAHWEGLPENSATLNNAALIYLNLFRATGDMDAVNKAVANFEKAVTLQRDDTILLHNTADQLLAKTLSEVVGQRIDLRLLRETGSFGHLEFLYLTKAEQDKLYASFRDRPGLAKVREYYERAQLLAPQKASLYGSLSNLYAYMRGNDKLRQLGKRLAEATLDQVEYTKLAKEGFAGVKDAKRRDDLTGTLARLEVELKEARKVGGPTFGVAVMNWYVRQGMLDALGKPADTEALVALAEEAHQAAPSQGTKRILNSALLFRAHKAIMKQEPTYAALEEKAKRSLPVDYVIALALFREGPPGKACSANADVQRVLNSLKDESDQFVERSTDWSWAMLHKTHPEAAAKAAAYLQKHERSKISRDIRIRIDPLGGDAAIRHYWALHMAGQAEEAEASLRAAVARGIPLPMAKK